MNLKFRAVAVGAVVVALAIASWMAFRPRGEQPALSDANQPQQTAQEGESGTSADYVMVGGVRRKLSDVEPAKPVEEPKPAEADGEKDKNSWDYGKLPRIPIDANPQVKAVVEAIQEKSHPERLSVMARPKPFDRESYKADPAAYLSVVELGRVFQTAQPGPGVPRLQAASPGFQMVTQGESVKLQVVAPPGSPVSFTSFDCGEFDNRLSAITVTANDDGVAEAKFTTTPGTIEDIHILAGCPVTSGQVKFLVNVQLPGNAVTATSASADAAQL